MLSLLATLLVAVLVGALVYWIIVTVVPLTSPFRNIALAIFGIFCIFYLIGLLTGSVPMISLGRLT